VSTDQAGRPIQGQLLRFCIVGAVAFLVDAGIVQGLVVWAQWNHYGARVLSYLAAASTAWGLNRRYTFGAGSAPIHREWLTYLAVNIGGGLVNYATYAALVLASDLVRAQPWLGVAAGSVSGLMVNFAANKWFVFRRRGA